MRCINRDQPSENTLSQLYINSGQDTKATALLDDPVVTTRAVNSPRSANQRHILKAVITSAVNQPRSATQNAFGAAVYKPRSEKKNNVWRAGFNSNRKTEAKSLLDDTTVSTRVVHQPPSAKQERIWLSCTSLARYSCISTAIKI